MKKFLKNNIKLILVFLLGIIVSSGITAYAVNNYIAGQIRYQNNTSSVDNVNDALDDLYNAANRDLTFGTVSYARSMGGVTVNGDRTVDKDVNKGKYFVTIVWSYAGDINTNTDERTNVISANNCASNITCTNGCKITSLGGNYSLAYSDSANSSNNYKYNPTWVCNYYVDVIDDNTTLTAINNFWGHSANVYCSENLMMNAIKVTK